MQALLRRRGLFLPLRRLCVGGDWRESIGTPKQTSELVVRNLPYGATSNDLRRAFGPVAHVTNVKISVDRTTGQNLGWAFVRILSNEADVETVLAEMHGSALRGRQLSVALASPEDRAHITPKERRPRTEDEDEQSAADARQWQIYKSRDTGDWFHRATPGSRTVALQKIIASSLTAADVLRTYEGERRYFDFLNAQTALHRLAILAGSMKAVSAECGGVPPLLDALVARISKFMDEKPQKWQPRHISNACWSVARLGETAGALEGGEFLLRVAARLAIEKMKNFETQELANMVWAHAKCGYPAPALFQSVALEAVLKMGDVNAKDVTNMAWAYVTLKVEAPALFEAMAKHAPKKMCTFKPQELAHTAWAFSEAGCAAPALFGAIADRARQKISAFNPRYLALIVSAFAKANVQAPMLFEAVAFEAQTPKMVRFSPKELCATLKAFSTLKIAAPLFFERAANEAVQKLPEYAPNDVADAVEAFAAMGDAGVSTTAFVKVVAKLPLDFIVALDAHRTLAIVCAFATLGLPPTWLDAAAPKMRELLQKDAPVRIRVAAGETAAAARVAAATASETATRDFDDAELAKLYEAYGLLQLDAPDSAVTRLLGGKCGALRAAHLREALRLKGSENGLPQVRLDAISTALKRIGWAHEAVYVTAEGVCVDFAQPAAGVAIIVDAADDYVLAVGGGRAGAASRRLSGAAAARGRLLERLGWRVVRLPVHEWAEVESKDVEALPSDFRLEAAEDAYLRAKTDPAAPQPETAWVTLRDVS